MDHLKISVSSLWLEQNAFFPPSKDLVCSYQTALSAVTCGFINAIYNQVFVVLLANRNIFKDLEDATTLPAPTLTAC